MRRPLVVSGVSNIGNIVTKTLLAGKKMGRLEFGDGRLVSALRSSARSRPFELSFWYYERGWPSYYNIFAGRKNVDVRSF
jgi:hypothetical protein